MTGRAIIDDIDMIEHRRLKAATGCVTDTAILVCCNVADVHTFCRAGPISYMTGIAARGQHGRVVVIDKRVGKIGCVMAQGTIGRG